MIITIYGTLFFYLLVATVAEIAIDYRRFKANPPTEAEHQEFIRSVQAQFARYKMLRVIWVLIVSLSLEPMLSWFAPLGNALSPLPADMLGYYAVARWGVMIFAVIYFIGFFLLHTSGKLRSHP